MKKIIRILFITILALVLIGCGDKVSKEVTEINNFISTLPTEVTIELETDVNRFINLYSKLSENEKKEVTKYQELVAAQNQINDLKNNNKAQTIIDLIASLKEEVTLNDESKYLEIHTKIYEASEEVILKIENKAVFDRKYQEYLELKALSSEDEEKAALVDILIEALPEEITIEDKEQIEVARNAYVALTTNQKVFVSKLGLLETKEEELLVLEKAGAKAVDTLIEALPVNVTIQDKEQIEAARNAYSVLTIKQKTFVTKLSVLEAKEAELNSLGETSELEIKIGSLPGNITLNDEAMILEIKMHIDKLTVEEKALISNFQKYLSSFYQYQELKINEYIEQSIPKYFIDEYSFPSEDPFFGISLNFTVSRTDLLSDGWVWHQENEEQVEIVVKYEVNEAQKEKQTSSIVLSEKYAYSALDFISQFKQPLARSYESISLKSSTYPEAIISFDSLNKDIFSNEGVLNRPTKDLAITLKVSVKFPGEDAKLIELDLKIKGLLMSEIAILLEQRFANSFGDNGLVTSDLNLPTFDEFYNVNIIWESGDAGIMANDGTFTNPGMENIPFSLKAKIVRADDESNIANLEFVLLAKGKPYENQWEAAEHLLQMSHLDEVSNQKFTMLGVTNYVAYNFGYIPFFTNTRSDITEGMIPLSHTNRPGTIRPGTKYITIHDTANARVGAGAEMHYRYVTNPTTTNASWHYSVDDVDIYQHLPNDEVGWHAGNTTSGLFSGNSYSVGIETCINEGVDYNKVMRRTAKLTAELLKNYNLTINDIKQHYDFSGKDCPRNMRHYKRWNEFLNLVKIEYFALYNLDGVTFTWESLNPTVLDHTGKVINHPGPDTRVNYKVTVEISGEKRIYEYSSLLKGLTF